MSELRVLYVHMIGAFGGSSRSLFEVVRAFPPGSVQPLFVAPRGTCGRYFSRLGPMVDAVGISRFDNTRVSRYQGLRWLVLLREIILLPFTWQAIRSARRRFGRVDLIHVNEVTGIIPLILAKHAFGVPAVVHVRALLNDDQKSRRTRWIGRVLRKHARALVAIDDTVRRSIPAGLPVCVIHNSFSPGGPFERDEALEGRLAALRPSSFKVGFVGNLLASKGIVELIEAMRIVRDAGVDAELVIAGDDAHSSRGIRARLLKPAKLSHDVRREVENRIARHGLADRVHMLGFTDNIDKVYQSMDIVCFPSHLDAPGRPIFEAAFYGVPSIVAIRNPTPDTFVHEGTGLAVEAGDVDGLAAAIMRLARDRVMVQHLGVRALALSNFDAARNMEKLLALYRDLCPAKAPAP